ncbi:unnamed protein product [Amoebophrya sp. A120]|nr:unnamed protein product [Amoebophrya sp. A120]|eukprot:GSA120T00014248001.1
MRPLKNDPLYTVVRPIPTILSPEAVVAKLEDIAKNTAFPIPGSIPQMQFDAAVGAVVASNGATSSPSSGGGQRQQTNGIIVEFEENATVFDQAIVLKWCDISVARAMHGTHSLRLESGHVIDVHVFQYQGKKCGCCSMLRD